MTKYVAMALFVVVAILTIIGLCMRVGEQNALIKEQENEIQTLKVEQERTIKAYEEDIAKREKNTRNRKAVVKEIIKVVGNEKCVNDPIDSRIIDRLQQYNKGK